MRERAAASTVPGYLRRYGDRVRGGSAHSLKETDPWFGVQRYNAKMVELLRKWATGRLSAEMETRPNQRLKLTGAAFLVSRGMKVLQAAPAA